MSNIYLPKGTMVKLVTATDGNEEQTSRIGKIGAVVRTDLDGGCFRGHRDVWFGDHDGVGNPVIISVPIDYLSPQIKVPMSL